MKKTDYYILFLSPGTFVSETNREKVPRADHNVEHALELAKGIVQRYGAKPYAFRFETKRCEETMSNGKVCRSEPEVTSSGLHYIDGEVLTLDDIADTEQNAILRSNMRCNDYPAVVRTCNGYMHHAPLGRDDVVLHGDDIVAKGEDYYCQCGGPK
jgi:hypothetical protein